MSIETKIAELHAALEANTAALSAVTAALLKLQTEAKEKAATTPAVSGTDKPVRNAKPKLPPEIVPNAAPAATPAAPVTATTTPEASAPAETAAASPSEVEHDGSPHSVTLADVQAAVKLKAASHRADVVAVLKKYGVAKASELKEDQYQMALDDLNAIGGEDLE